ncbi:MAG: hypothetical protein IJH63_10305 [Methanobrevibacter sp.]|nr:hypothetical protein [Methanosphaera sp.]MBR0371091.1 hypothetical protein [Methanobrevibacter sp.]
MTGNEIRNKICIEDGKPEIDLSNWLNAVTNLPSVWQQILSEVLTDRYGVFTYNYTDTLNHTRDGEIIYSKPYSIDLKISIGRTINDIDGEVFTEILELSENQKERMTKIQNLVELFGEYINTGSIDLDKIKKGLDEL